MRKDGPSAPTEVSVSNTSIHGSCASISPGLMWCEPRPQIAPSSAQLWQDLIP